MSQAVLPPTSDGDDYGKGHSKSYVGHRSRGRAAPTTGVTGGGKNSLALVSLSQTYVAHPFDVEFSWADSLWHPLGVGVPRCLCPRLSSQRAVWRQQSVLEFSSEKKLEVMSAPKDTHSDWRSGPTELGSQWLDACRWLTMFGCRSRRAPWRSV